MGPPYSISNSCQRDYGPIRSQRQQMLLHMPWANTKVSTGAATEYAVGQCKGIGSFCFCIGSGPMQRHRQALQQHMQRANTNASAASAVAYATGQCNGIGSSCSCICNGPIRMHWQL